jgi:exodeoxyribonuclease VII large subunit
LARGYSISFKQGEIVKNTQQVQVGDILVTRLKSGEIHSEINHIQKQ